MSVTTASRDINQLHPVVQAACKLFLQECIKAGVNIFITETYRSQARQNYLYAQGRTRFSGPVVTWTLNSNHKSKLAWYIAVSPPKSLYDVSELNKEGAIARKLGITWGGDWKTIDRPHFEVKTSWKAPASTIKKEEIIMPKLYKPTSQAVKDSTRKILVKLSNEKVNPLSDTWWKKLDAGTLTESDATGLLYVALDRYVL